MTCRFPALIAATAVAIVLAAAGISLRAGTEGPTGAGPAVQTAVPGAKLDGYLQAASASDAAVGRRYRVMIRLADATAFARIGSRLDALQRPVHARLIEADVLVATVERDDLRWLDASADVTRVSIDAPMEGAASWVSSSPMCLTCRMLRTLGLDSWTLAASAVTVGVVDSGIEAASDLPVSAFYDFTGGNPNPAKTTAYDDFGHGTHVASLIANSGKDTGNQFRGVAPGVKLIGLKVLNSGGGGYASHVIAAIDFAIRNKATLKIDILNLSLGHPIYEPAATDPLVRAVERAVANGIFVVVSAGNHGLNPVTGQVGYAGITSPGNAPSALTVGSVDTQGTQVISDDAVAPYSSRGPSWYDGYAKPDLVAYGHRLTSNAAVRGRLTTSYPNSIVTVGSRGRKYMTLTGTSMAAAVASGVAAQALAVLRATTKLNSGLTLNGVLPSAAVSHIEGWCADYGIADCSPYTKGLTPNWLKAVLMYTALPLPNDDLLSQGAGEINPLGVFEFTSAHHACGV